MLLLRHASAGQRLTSPEIDTFRRLDDAGRVTARQLVWALADRAITQVVSSPLVRCLESVIPLAQSRGLVVEEHWELAPDAPVEDLLALLLDLPDTTLACTHREAFEKLLGWDVTIEKGGAWVLERGESELVPALYLAPPASVGVGQRQAV
jgi:phosphohistidine phosphatase SixA